MRQVLNSEKSKEVCNAAALGMANAAAEVLASEPGEKDPYQKIYNDFNAFEKFFDEFSKKQNQINNAFHTARNLMTDIQQKE